jgi:hypothetical protein
MRVLPIGVLCVLCAGIAAIAQSSTIPPIHLSAGAVLTFYLQTRLTPARDNPFDTLPKGTVLRVKLVDGVDSRTEIDGGQVPWSSRITAGG